MKPPFFQSSVRVVDVGGQISNRLLYLIYFIISSILLRVRRGAPETKGIPFVIRKRPEAIGGVNT